MDPDSRPPQDIPPQTPAPINPSPLSTPPPPKKSPFSSKKVLVLALVGAIAVFFLIGMVILAQSKPASNSTQSTETTDLAAAESTDESAADSAQAQTTETTPATTEPAAQPSASKPSSSGSGSGGSSSSGGTTPSTPQPQTHTITYTGSCYSPANVTIKNGDTVKFVNNSNDDMWPASNNHPSHNIYPEFDSDGDVAPGGSYSFTFTKTGSWGYHDHNAPPCGGTITVN